MRLREEGDGVGVVVVLGGEEPAGVAVDDFVVGEDELWEELVAVGVVEGAAAVVAAEAVFVVLVVAPALTGRAVFGEAVGDVLAGLVHDDEFAAAWILVGFAEVAPEAGLVDEVAAGVVEVPAGFVGDFDAADLGGGAAHVGGAEVAVGAAAAAGDEKSGGEGEEESPEAHGEAFSGEEGGGQECSQVVDRENP